MEINLKLSREHKFAGAVAGADWSVQGKRDWNRQLTDQIDWRRIPLLTRQHKIRPMMAAAFREAKWASVPAEVFDEVQRADALCMRKALTQLATLTSIAAGAGKLGIRLLSIKGLCLSRYLYGNPIIRESFDLDILVHPGDLAGMTEILAREQIFPVFAPPLSAKQTGILRRFNKHDSFRQTGSGLIVECHYGFDHNPGRITTDFEGLWERRSTVTLSGEKLSLPGGKDLAHYLCVHAARHCWDRWKWLGDMAAICRRSSEEEMNEYREWARTSGNLAIFDATLLLTAQVTGLRLPDELKGKAACNRNAGRTAERSLRLAAGRLTAASQPSRVYLARQLIERLRQKPSLTCIWHETAVLAHYPRDWYAHRLPDRMIWAYYVLRILSLCGAGVAGGVRSAPASNSDQSAEVVRRLRLR